MTTPDVKTGPRIGWEINTATAAILLGALLTLAMVRTGLREVVAS